SGDSSDALPVAEAIARSIRCLPEGDELIEELSVVAPGYLNFHLRNACLAEVLCLIHQKKDVYGQELLDDSQQAALSLWREFASALGNGKTRGLDSMNSEMIGPTSRQDPASFMGYVHGRCDSVIRLIQEESFNIVEGKIDPPLFIKD